MRIAVLLFVLSLAGSALGDMVFSSTSRSVSVDNLIAFLGNDRRDFFDFDVSSSATLNGTLDTDASTIAYDASATAFPQSTQSATAYRLIFVPGTPLIPPTCDLNGCTGGSPGTPDTFIRTDFVLTITQQAASMTTEPATVSVSSVSTNSASTDDLQIAPNDITWQWTISGPTESASGTLTSQFTTAPLTNSINISRQPPNTGVVDSWNPIFRPRREAKFIDGAPVVVDGVTWTVSVSSIPEPSSFALLGVIGGLVAAYKRFA